MAMRDRDAALPLSGLAAACGVALVLAYLALERTEAGQRLDEQALDRRALASRPARYAIHTLLTTIGTGMVVVVLAALAAQAIVRRRPPLALVGGAVVAGSTLITELLKHTLTRPQLYYGEPFGNVFPSGHTTVAFSVGVAAAFVAPPRLRTAVAGAAIAYAAAVGIAVVAAGWHRPSDVAGAYLVVTGWSALVAIASARRFPGIFSAEPPRPGAAAIEPRHLLLGVLALAAGYVAMLAAVLARRGGDIDWTLPGHNFLGACVALVALVTLLGAALLLALRMLERAQQPLAARRGSSDW